MVPPPDPPPASPPTPPLFQCIGAPSQCLFPRRLQEMLFACARCAAGGDFREWNDLTAVEQPALGAFPGGVRPACGKHSLSIVPHCPVCHQVIHVDAHGPPTGIWAGASAGKTVYCAVASALMQRDLFRLTGMHRIDLSQDPRYQQDVVNPLMLSGILPHKTKEGEQRKLVMHLQGGGWRQRTVTVTDLAGEVWDGATQFTTGYKADARASAIHTRDSLFLLNPHATGGGGPFGARVAPDLSGPLSRILEDVHQAGMTVGSSRNDIEALVRRLESLLAQRQFPAVVRYDLGAALALADEVLFAVRATLPRPAPTGLAEQLASSMSVAAQALTNMPTFKDTLGQLVIYLRDQNYPKTREGKLAHRLAVVVSKADLAGLRGPSPSHQPGPAPSQWQHWISALSAANRAWLVNELGVREFVEYAEASFEQVGWFFTSSLGRDTELVVDPNPDAAAAAALGVAANYQPRGGAQLAPAGGTLAASACPWRINRRLRCGDNGTRTPQPTGVLEPFLWLWGA